MSFRIEKRWVAFESCSMETFDPAYFNITKECIEEYMAEHPMPDDSAYSKEELIYDLTESGGFYAPPEGTDLKTIGYIEDMLNSIRL